MGREKLRSWMKDNDINVADLAFTLGVSGSLVYGWLNGSNQMPKWLALTLPTISIKLAARKAK